MTASNSWIARIFGSEVVTLLILATIGSAALLKSLDFGPFVALISATKFVPKGLEPATGVSIVLLEVLAVASLTLGLKRWSSILCSILGTGIIAFGIWRLAANYGGSCHCFGDLLELSAPQSIAIGVVILLVGGAQFLGPHRSRQLGVRVPALLIVLSGVYAVYFLTNSQPDEQKIYQVKGVSLQPSYGRVEKDSAGQYLVRFTLVNNSDASVEVNASPSCGCVKGSWSTARLQPHSKTTYLARGAMPDFVLFRILSGGPAYLYGKPNAAL